MTIKEATDLSLTILAKLGFQEEESRFITQNLIEAELVEKKTHGLIRLLSIVENVKAGKVNVTADDIELIREHKAALHFNGKYKPGWYVIYKSLEKALEKVKDSGIVAVSPKKLFLCLWLHW